MAGFATLIARTFAPDTGSPVPHLVTVPVIVPVVVLNVASGYSSEMAATSSASSVRRPVPAIENGCIVGESLSWTADSAPSLPVLHPTVE